MNKAIHMCFCNGQYTLMLSIALRVFSLQLGSSSVYSTGQEVFGVSPTGYGEVSSCVHACMGVEYGSAEGLRPSPANC